MTIKDENLDAASQRGAMLMAAGGLLGALAASSCCILPLETSRDWHRTSRTSLPRQCRSLLADTGWFTAHRGLPAPMMQRARGHYRKGS
jgi:hypothetical protein